MSRSLFLTALLALAIAVPCVAETQRDLALALESRSPQALQNYRPEKVEDIYAKQTVEEIAALARVMKVLIKSEAARKIVEYLTTGEIPENIRRWPRPSPSKQEGDRKRFALLLLSRSQSVSAETGGSALILPEKAVEEVIRELKGNRIAGFCPCWPFCRG